MFDAAQLREAVVHIHAHDFHRHFALIVGLGPPDREGEDLLLGEVAEGVMIVLGDEYATYAGDAAWADIKFGLGHGWDFSRVALVTDIGWMAKAARLFALLMPFDFEVFPMAELDAAKGWIRR